MIMKRLIVMLFAVTALLTGLMLLPFGLYTVHASSAHAAHEEEVTEQAHGEHNDELPGEVPFDRAVEEIQPYLAPMNELNLFPCSDCHDADWEVNPERRDLDEPHNEIPGKLMNHDEENRWCLSCHSANNRDKLMLQNGNLIEFNAYYMQCAQCHKRIYREWKMGVHGKRTGNWKGDKEYMHCTQCHNPHNPPFQAIKPEPAPRKPLNIRTSSSSEASSSTADTKH